MSRQWVSRLASLAPQPAWLLRLAGPTSLVRRLSAQSVLSAFGDGVFLTGSAVFFTQIVDLSPAQSASA